MLPKLYRNEKVQRELSKFKIKIDQIKNDKARDLANKTLRELKEEIETLDSMHRSTLIGDLKPNLFYMHREKILEKRKLITKLLKENNLK
jgi:FKBP-type peptidyl-prolyl cis-trans isomerase (trigger factor)